MILREAGNGRRNKLATKGARSAAATDDRPDKANERNVERERSGRHDRDRRDSADVTGRSEGDTVDRAEEWSGAVSNSNATTPQAVKAMF